MANPWSPFSRAAAMFSSGLETPSPEKKVWVWRSMLKGTAGRLIWPAQNGKYRFQGMGGGLSGAREGRAGGFIAQRRDRRGPGRLRFSLLGVLPFPDFLSRTTGEGARAGRVVALSAPRRGGDLLFRKIRSAKGGHCLGGGGSA